MFTILPDRGITKIAETVLASAICGFLPICSVIRLGIQYFTLNWVDCHCFIIRVLLLVHELHTA
ncbi:MAG: hypothetical protein NC453_00445, partial [Muribaculum sp.]|nr:hypothetical protein [Muribaculum sp.]